MFGSPPSPVRATNLAQVFWLGENLTRIPVRATITWRGAGDARWSSPKNWEGGVLPGESDIVRFVSASRDALVDSAFGGTVAGILLEPGHAGTLQLDRDLIIRGGRGFATG